MDASHTIRPVFDDPNLVSAAGLVPVLRLAESAGLHDLLGRHLSIDSPNAAAKTPSVIGGMLTGAEELAALLRSKRSVPGDLDRALLVDLSDALDMYNLTDPIRYRLRERFWLQCV